MTRLAIWLGVFAVVVRCVIGAGVMPDPKALAAGQFGLVICTGSGMKVVPSAPENSGTPVEHGSICAFAAFVHLGAPADAASLVGHDFGLALVAASLPALRVVAVVDAARARAPPAIS